MEASSVAYSLVASQASLFHRDSRNFRSVVALANKQRSFFQVKKSFAHTNHYLKFPNNSFADTFSGRQSERRTDRPTGRPNGGQNKTSKRTALKVETHYHIFEAAQERSAAAIAVNDAAAKKLKNKAWKKINNDETHIFAINVFPKSAKWMDKKS